MPKAKAAKIADSANLIVGGYAMMMHELGFRIVNLNYLRMYVQWRTASINGFYVG